MSSYGFLVDPCNPRVPLAQLAAELRDVMVPKAVNSIRSQVTDARRTAEEGADAKLADAVSRARGRRPSVVEATFQGGLAGLE
eukprot:g31866.t1